MSYHPWRTPLSLVVLLLALGALPLAGRAGVADFEDLGLTGTDQFENGTNLSGSFLSHGLTFLNDHGYDPTYGYEYWSGFAYSSMTDTTTPGFGNQLSAITGAGAGGSLTYGIGFIDFYTPNNPVIELPAGQSVVSADFTNTTYAYLSMRDGDGPGGFAKNFGGVSGSDPDWFLLTITGLDAGNAPIAADPVEFYLADYRSANNSQDYILDQWTTVDLSGLAAARKLSFALDSSDIDSVWGGFFTPAYFAIDNVITTGGGAAGVPEPATLVLLLLGAAGLSSHRRRR